MKPDLDISDPDDLDCLANGFLFKPLVAENERLRETLGLIAMHARLDIKERGIEEARRYLLLAEDALNAR